MNIPIWIESGFARKCIGAIAVDADRIEPWVRAIPVPRRNVAYQIGEHVDLLAALAGRMPAYEKLYLDARSILHPAPAIVIRTEADAHRLAAVRYNRIIPLRSING